MNVSPSDPGIVKALAEGRIVFPDAPQKAAEFLGGDAAPAAALHLTLPYPPSVNHYWRYVGGRPLISKEGRQYRTLIVGEVRLLRLVKLRGRLNVRLEFFPPDKRRRDLDNLNKALLDALQHAGVYGDDSQIDRLELVRMRVVRGGRTQIEITEL